MLPISASNHWTKYNKNIIKNHLGLIEEG